MFYLLIALLMGLASPSDIDSDPNGTVVTPNSASTECQCEDPESCVEGECDCENPEGCGGDDDTGGENGPIRPPKP